MRKIDLQLMARDYEVRRLTEKDVEMVYNLCKGNPLYYEYCPPMVTREQIREDMQSLPPKVAPDCKYYIGFRQNKKLFAVMDLIDGYPQSGIAYIGFFMTDQSVQGKGIGTDIISQLCDYLQDAGFDAVQLAWVKGNPQSEHFWLKNDFTVIRETTSTVAEHVILSERKLRKQ